MKRLTAALIAVIMLLPVSFYPSALKAERASAVFSMPNVTSTEQAPPQHYGNFSASIITARPGDTVTIYVMLYGSFEAHGLNLRLNYDNTALTVHSTEYGEVLAQVGSIGGVVLLDHTTIPNSIRLGVLMPTNPFTANGVIFSAKVTVSPDVPNGTAILLDLEVEEFIYMPIGVTNPPNMSHSVADGKIIVSESGPTPSPTPRPTATPGTPTALPSSTPGSPTALPSLTPGSPTPSPTPRPSSTPTQRPSSAPATPTPAPVTTPTARPTNSPAAPTAAPVTPGTASPGGNSAPTPTAPSGATADPSASIDPFARFSASPFPTIDLTPYGGKVTPDPEGSVAPTSGADTASPDASASVDPFARFSPNPLITLEPAEPSAAPKIGMLVAVGAIMLAAASAIMLLTRRKRDDEE